MVEREVVIGEQVADPEMFKPIFTVDGATIDAYKAQDEVQERLSRSIAAYDSPSGRESSFETFVFEPTRRRFRAMDVEVTDSTNQRNVIPMVVRDQTGGDVREGAAGSSPMRAEAIIGPAIRLTAKPLEGAWFLHVDRPDRHGSGHHRIQEGVRTDGEPCIPPHAGPDFA